MKLSFVGRVVGLAELERRPSIIPPGQIQVKTNTHIWHVGVYVGFRAEVGGPAVIHFQHCDQTKKVPAFGPGRVSFEHIRAFLSPYNATTFEYVPNDVAKRQPRPPHEIVLRAFSFYQRGFGEYNCAVNNCEDFVLQCVYAMPPLLSDQTKGYAEAAAAGAIGGLILASTVLQQEAEAANKQKKKRTLMPACLVPRVD